MCSEAFKKEVFQWLLVNQRKNKEEKEKGEENKLIGCLPLELQFAVIRELCLLHHPIVTMNPVTGKLRGIEAALDQCRKYAFQADAPNERQRQRIASEQEKPKKGERCTIS